MLISSWPSLLFCLHRKKESSEIRISVEEIMKLVGKIEDDMYKAFKDTSHRYKAKYRTLMFNLRDPRNKVGYTVRCSLYPAIPSNIFVFQWVRNVSMKCINASWQSLSFV